MTAKNTFSAFVFVLVGLNGFCQCELVEPAKTTDKFNSDRYIECQTKKEKKIQKKLSSFSAEELKAMIPSASPSVNYWVLLEIYHRGLILDSNLIQSIHCMENSIIYYCNYSGSQGLFEYLVFRLQQNQFQNAEMMRLLKAKLLEEEN